MKTKKRPRAAKKVAPPPEPTPEPSRAGSLPARIRYVDALLSSRLDMEAAEARDLAILEGRIPSVSRVVVAYQRAYSDCMDDDAAVILLETFVEAARDDSALGLADFLEGYLNEDGRGPRVDPMAIPDTKYVFANGSSIAFDPFADGDVPVGIGALDAVPGDPLPWELPAGTTVADVAEALVVVGVTPDVVEEVATLATTPPPKARRARKPKAKDPLDPPNHEPLPGQQDLAFVGPDETQTDDGPETTDEVVLEVMWIDAATAAEAAVAKKRAGGAAGARPWPAGQAVKYKVGKHWVSGTVVEDSGDGRLTFTRDAAPDAPPWVVDRARCKKIKAATPAAAPAAAPEVEPIVLEIPETVAAKVEVWLASPLVEGAEPGAELEAFAMMLGEGDGALLATVVNGTPGALGPHVLFWVFAPFGEAEESTIAFELPPQDRLLGRFTVAVHGRPVPLDVVAVPDAEAP